jgi:hypothetical protein
LYKELHFKDLFARNWGELEAEPLASTVMAAYLVVVYLTRLYSIE